MNTIITYGTLRQEGKLRQYYKLNTLKKEDTLKGYYLKSYYNNYPIMYYSGLDEDITVIEVCQVDDKEFNKIKKMELNVGYILKKVKTESGIEGYIFCQEIDNINSDKIYDWIKHISNVK
jgi:gamma-glutamylcyclotransferase (GGCT)/AIG2-like uncharacterized protein YtfP